MSVATSFKIKSFDIMSLNSYSNLVSAWTEALCKCSRARPAKTRPRNCGKERFESAKAPEDKKSVVGLKRTFTDSTCAESNSDELSGYKHNTLEHFISQFLNSDNDKHKNLLVKELEKVYQLKQAQA